MIDPIESRVMDINAKYLGMPEDQLMERAGRGAAENIRML